MAAGNGTDLGSVVAMLSQLVTGQDRLERDMIEVKRDLAGIKREMGDVKLDVGELKRDTVELKRNVAENTRDIAALRQEVAVYHGSVMGHGIAISELGERAQRTENHLGLPPFTPH